jgi:hypothetical protein
MSSQLTRNNAAVLGFGTYNLQRCKKNTRFDTHFFSGMLWFEEKSGGHGWGLQISGVGKILIALSPVYQLGDNKSINNSDNPVPLILNTTLRH